MLAISNLTKSFGNRILFNQASLTVNAGERIGLIGRNGHGKSTLLRIIDGKEAPDEGEINLQSDVRVGVLEQYFAFQGRSVLEEAESVLPLLEGAYRETFKAEKVLEGLGFDQEKRSLPPGKLSGGFQIRLNLCKLLLTEPELLLLDEPTNYLDIVSVRWLEEFLIDWKGAAILVSHDRSFIDRVSTHIALIYRSSIRKSEGSTHALYQRIAEEEEIHERTRKNQLKERERVEQFVRTYRSKARQASRVQSRVKALEKQEVLEKLETEEDLSFRFSYEPFTPKWIMNVKELAFGFGDTPLFSGLNFALASKDRLAVVGPNGMGKSSLLSVLTERRQPTSGSVEIHSSASIGFLGQSNLETLHPEKTVEELILEVEEQGNRTRARTIAGCMLFSGSEAEKKARVLSGGEKTRVHLGRIIARKTNLLFLDEPTNHLDFHSCQALLDALKSYSGAIVLVTHDEEFLEEAASRLIVFKGGNAALFEGGYQDFLRREGWEDDGTLSTSGSSKEAIEQRSKKDLRREKARINQERSKVLKPLKRKIKEIEDAIEEHESCIKDEQQELIEITKEGFNDRAADLSRSLSKRKSEIEELFVSLEEVSNEISEAEENFAKQMSACSDE